MSARLHRWLRRLGLGFMATGVLALVWALVVWQWQDPFTALYTLYEQHELSHAYARRTSTYQLPAVVPPSPLPSAASRARAAKTRQAAARARLAAEEQAVDVAARRYRLTSHEGEPLGKIIVPRLGLNMIFLDGTDESTLQKGPGRDLATFMPGESRLVYIAGHRTTFLAPFSNINLLRRGDRITLELPYATFVYRVTHHIIVPYNDMSVLRSGHAELLALQACHPRFFATHRYIVYATPVKVIPVAKIGHAYAPKTLTSSARGSLQVRRISKPLRRGRA